MIEKTFDKMYPLDAPKGTLTRVAKRLFNEYRAVMDSYGDDIIALVDKIKRGEETDDYSDEYNNTTSCASYGDRVYDTCTCSTEARVHAFYDEDEYGEPMYHVTWYLYSSEWYKKRVGGKTVAAGDYQTMCRRVYAAKGKYRYYCTHRPPSIGCIPDGAVSYETYLTGSEHIGEATYNELPSAAEIERYGLVYDPAYERDRAIWLSEDNA